MKTEMVWRVTLPRPLAAEDGVSTVFGPFNGVSFSLDDCDERNWYRAIRVTSYFDIPEETVAELRGERGHETAQPWFDRNFERVGPKLNQFYPQH